MERCEILSVERDSWTKCWWIVRVRSQRGKGWVILFTITRDREFIHLRIVDEERLKNDVQYMPQRFYIPIDKRTLHRLYPGNESEVPKFFNRIVLPFVLEKISDF